MGLFPQGHQAGFTSPKKEEEKKITPLKEEKALPEEKTPPLPKEETPLKEPKEEIVPEKKPEAKAEKPEVKEEAKEEKKEPPKDPPKDPLENFPTSVRIAGLTTKDDMILSDLPQTEESVRREHESNENDESATLILSEQEKEELSKLSEEYFEKYDADNSPFGGVSLEDILELAIDQDASDIHFSAGKKIALRIKKEIFFIENIPELSTSQTKYLVFTLIGNPLYRKKLFEEKEMDYSYQHQKTGINFRVNIFFQKGRLSAVLRKIASHAMTVEQLNIPEKILDLLKQKQGLILVTGPTGSGKSTSLQAMLEHINSTRVEHILTIEDPIEYIFTDNKSIFSQRELGKDTHSFGHALKASLREDPDIVVIGEMRDKETIQAAMTLSETGHLVFSTLHTSSAPQTVSRLISQFPPEEQHNAQHRLADTLIGVLSQRLIPRSDRSGIVAIYELMIVNSAIKSIIKSGDMTQIHNAMLAGREHGMVRMEEYAYQLEEEGVVSEESFANFFREE
jgi:twitching motility protein PilT